MFIKCTSFYCITGTTPLVSRCGQGVTEHKTREPDMRKPATYSREWMDEGETGQCPCCLRAIRISSTGRMVRHGWTVNDAGYHNYNECPGWKKSPLEETDKDAQAYIVELKANLDRGVDEAQAAAITQHIRMIENAVQVHFLNPHEPGTPSAAIALTEFNKSNEQADEAAKEERREARATKAQLKRRKVGYADQWEDLKRQATDAAWDAAKARGEDLFGSQSVYDFEDAIPYSPAHWNAKRRAKAEATGLLDSYPQFFGWMDAVSDQFKTTAAQLKEMGGAR